MTLKIKHFFDSDTGTLSYVVVDLDTRNAAVIDPVLNYDPVSGRTATKGADQIIEYMKSEDLKLEWLLETHIHADHLSAAHYIQGKCGGKIAIGSSIVDVLHYWTEVFNISQDTPLDGSQFDVLFQDNETFKLGNTSIRLIHTPGHTPACSSYLIEDNVFVGDLLFMPDVGAGRADFPGASAKSLYHSIQKIFSLPEDTKVYTKVYTCHDYPPNKSREVRYFATVKEQKESNILIRAQTTESEFVKMRTEKDLTNTLPRLIFPSIQVNIRGGRLGSVETNNTQYIKIPLNRF
jgi:glyoxylase-like metal-dependent hydrolase (beta-lactamase superfamily II)